MNLTLISVFDISHIGYNDLQHIEETLLFVCLVNQNCVFLSLNRHLWTKIKDLQLIWMQRDEILIGKFMTVQNRCNHSWWIDTLFWKNKNWWTNTLFWKIKKNKINIGPSPANTPTPNSVRCGEGQHARMCVKPNWVSPPPSTKMWCLLGPNSISMEITYKPTKIL